ncbi:MAG: threonylcarbamoyl-AMP synthase [Dehalococcoidia bacterium]|nr:threonylcarbamoyl-AMP synthase [Dehalococcoidia bacterium]
MGSTFPEEPAIIAEAARLLAAGRLVVLPTDTVYGLCAAPWDASAVERMYEAKGRVPGKPIPLLVSSIDAAEDFAELDDAERKLAASCWPGPLTIVVRVRYGFESRALAGGRTAGIRMPDHFLARAVIERAGGVLAVTSANRSMEANSRTVDEARADLGDMVDLYVDGGQSAGSMASTVVAIEAGRLVIVREGPLSREELETALAG